MWLFGYELVWFGFELYGEALGSGALGDGAIGSRIVLLGGVVLGLRGQVGASVGGCAASAGGGGGI